VAVVVAMGAQAVALGVSAEVSPEGQQPVLVVEHKQPVGPAIPAMRDPLQASSLPVDLRILRIKAGAVAVAGMAVEVERVTVVVAVVQVMSHF
jgi:hypothetical protein